MSHTRCAKAILQLSVLGAPEAVAHLSFFHGSSHFVKKRWQKLLILLVEFLHLVFTGRPAS